MKKLGHKKDVANEFQILEQMNFKEPLYFPDLGAEKKLMMCGLDFGTGEVLYICDTYRDMRLLYMEYNKRTARKIFWYIGQRKKRSKGQ